MQHTNITRLPGLPLPSRVKPPSALGRGAGPGNNIKKAVNMTSNVIDKQKLIQRLKQARANVVDEENQMRFMYQTGGNILVDVLLAEIAFGDLDANNEGK